MHGAIWRGARGEYNKEDDEEPTWRSLPEKRRLAHIFTSRLFDFVQITAIQSYILEQLRSFNYSMSDSQASKQVGMLNGGYTAAQAVTSIIWGRISDVPWIRRKPILLSGLIGTAIACVGLGFSQKFSQALGFRILGGAINGNGGISITMIAESFQDKRHLARAFLVLPLSFNFAAFIGPILGGCLSNPIANYPHIFGPGSMIGGESGVSWMKSFPYALPAVICAGSLLICALLSSLLLKEPVLIDDRAVIDLHLSSLLSRDVPSNHVPYLHEYSRVSQDEEGFLNGSPTSVESKCSVESQRTITPDNYNGTCWDDAKTKRIMYTLLTQAIFDFHISGFGCIWILFLCSPRVLKDKGVTGEQASYSFSSGLGMSARKAGFITSIIGLVGVPLQLFVYPWIHNRFGTVRSYKLFSGLFPISYALIPFISLCQPNSKDTGLIVWFSLTLILALHTIGRVVSVPATISLINESSPHPSVLGAVNGIGQSVSAVSRTLGPIVSAYTFAYGAENGLFGISWWVLAGVALIGTLLI